MTIGLADACQPDDAGVMRTYVEMVRRAGHLPLILPATRLEEETCCQLEAIDELLLVGGGDLAAEHFGAQPTPYDGEPNLLRDEYELLLMRVALRMGKPVVGICRGMQVINVALGGTLCQHLPLQWPMGEAAERWAELKPLLEHSRPDKKWEPVHEICIDSHSRLAQTLHTERIGVNSTHHQAVAQLGRGLRAVAWSEDGVIEAIESDLYPIWAVQFHPERLLEWGHLLFVAPAVG